MVWRFSRRGVDWAVKPALMNRIQFIGNQMQSARSHTKKLLTAIPQEKWLHIPAVINSNIAWQAGHLVISQFYHSVMVVAGAQTRPKKEVPIRQYASFFSRGGRPVAELPPELSPKNIIYHLDVINETAKEVLQQLTDAALDQPLEPTSYPHPIAKTKYEALCWCFRHEMWHCGQISLLGRVLGHETNW